MKYDVLVIGGGAAGCMAAGFAAKNGNNVLLAERNDRIGRKVMITGKGRCNVTNACSLLNELIENVPVNGRFLYGAFSRFMPYDTMDFFEELGVELKIERGNRVFPVSDKAVEIVDALNAFINNNGVKKIKARIVKLNTENDHIISAQDENGNIYEADKYIIATGGKSYPLTGSTGDGYSLARQCGHTVTPLKPALVPLVTSDEWTGQLQGLSLKNISITVRDNDTYNEVFNDFGELLFTHFGVSGPVILSASSHMKNLTDGKYSIEIDLKPGLSDEKLDARILRDFAENANKSITNALSKLLPHKLIPVIVRLSGIPTDLKVNQITKDMRQDLVYLLKHFTVTVKEFRPIEEAIVTSGGVSVKEINPKTMQSTLCDNLYFAGEVIDVDAYTGGFNLQIAFSTGVLAGKSV
ncbi:MAG: NAD(P)/FAD-dependent oxidoreductase [Clostridia bacterium]|nr:NAD(P)/FAD-dependent oxidoreductase [Clostridia bacterium]